MIKEKFEINLIGIVSCLPATHVKFREQSIKLPFKITINFMIIYKSRYRLTWLFSQQEKPTHFFHRKLMTIINFPVTNGSKLHKMPSSSSRVKRRKVNEHSRQPGIAHLLVLLCLQLVHSVSLYNVAQGKSYCKTDTYNICWFGWFTG